MLIQHENLTIRNATADDASLLGNWWRDGKVMAHAGFPLGISVTDEEIAASLETDTDETHRRLMIEVDGVPVGEMNYRDVGNKTAELGIKICDFTMQEKGYGTKLLSMLIGALFGQYGYEKMILDTNMNNKRAQHVYEKKLGFRNVGEQIDAWTDQLGVPQSMVNFEMTKHEFISHICRHWWGCIYDQYEHGSDDTRLLLALIGDTPRTVFEVCCGSGRVLVPLAEAGHNVVGIDADAGMLARIPAKAKGLTNIRYTLADALTTDWGSAYDVVVLGCNTLMNIEHRDDDKAAQQLFIQKAADALKVGGHFFLAFDHYPKPEDVFVREGSLTRSWYSGTDDTGVFGQTYSCGGLYNPVTRIAVWANHIELTMPDGVQYIMPTHGHKYVCTREEVHGWLKGAGFVIEQEYGDCNRAPFTGQQGWDVVWARKVE